VSRPETFLDQEREARDEAWAAGEADLEPGPELGDVAPEDFPPGAWRRWP
jgi:hypothetical protein